MGSFYTALAEMKRVDVRQSSEEEKKRREKRYDKSRPSWTPTSPIIDIHYTMRLLGTSRFLRT